MPSFGAVHEAAPLAFWIVGVLVLDVALELLDDDDDELAKR